MENTPYTETFPALTEEKAAEFCDLNSSSFPLSKFVGNVKARRRLSRCIKAALTKEDHSLEDFSFALLGPASVGKTTLAKKISESVQLPFVSIEPKAINSTANILEKIVSAVKKKYGRPTIGFKGKTINLPPMVVFIDEVHNLSKKCVQGLLKATEKKDGILDTGEFLVNCKRVCWIVATTEAGRLFGPFQTRFTKISLNLYSEEEIAQIVDMENDWGMEVSRLVAKYGGRVPREALQFAQEMKAEGGNWEETAKIIAEDMEIDLDWCMTRQRIAVLKSMANGPIPKALMCNIANCQIEELERMVMPALMSSTEESVALVTTTSRGYALTASGANVLDRHNVLHKPILEFGEQNDD